MPAKHAQQRNVRRLHQPSLSRGALELRAIIPVVLLDPELSGVSTAPIHARAVGRYLFSIRDLQNATELVAKFLMGALPEEATFFGGYAFLTDLGVVDSAVSDFQVCSEWDRAFQLIGETSPVPVRVEHEWKLIRSDGVISLRDYRQRVIAGPETLFLSQAKAAVKDMRTFSEALRQRLRGLVPEKTLKNYFGKSSQGKPGTAPTP